MILAQFPEGSSLTAPGRDCKLPQLCWERQSSLRLPDMWMTVTEAEEMVRFRFFSRWRGLKSYLHLSEAGGHIVWARAWAFSHVDGLSARFKAPEICLGDKLPAQRGTTADRAFKAVQLDWRASVCLPRAWLLNPAFLLLTICPKSSQRWASRLPVNTWYWCKYCCSTKTMRGRLQEV